MSHETWRILLIDDDDAEFILMKDILSFVKQGATLEWASTYEEALRLVKLRAHDAYLVDYHLKDSEPTGIDLIREAKAGGCSAPMILMTGRGDHALDLEAMSADAADFLVKGQFSPELLERSLRYAIARGRLWELESRVRQAERLSTIGQFAAGIAHELNNPLSAIYGFSKVAIADAPPGVLHDQLAAIVRAATRCRTLIQGLLGFSRREEPAAEYQVVEAAEEALTLVEAQARFHGVTILRDYKEPKANLIGHRGRLEQALINLCANAIDAMPKGGKLQVAIRRDGASLLVEVADSGTGIPEEVRERLFEPFFTTKAAGKGTGLGLSITRDLVEQMGGRIELRSEKGRGTTFTLRLPSPKKEAAGV